MTMLGQTSGINYKCQTLKTDCLTRIRDLRAMLESIEKQVLDDNAVLNDLGELQSQPVMLDCRLASLATLRMLRNEEREE